MVFKVHKVSIIFYDISIGEWNFVIEFIFRIFISIISFFGGGRMPYLLAFIHVRILISKRRMLKQSAQWNITRVNTVVSLFNTLVSSYDGITSLFMCSSVSEAWDQMCFGTASFNISIYVYLVICTLDVFTKDRNIFQPWGNVIFTIIFLIYYYHVYLFREGPFYTLIRSVT